MVEAGSASSSESRLGGAEAGHASCPNLYYLERTPCSTQIRISKTNMSDLVLDSLSSGCSFLLTKDNIQGFISPPSFRLHLGLYFVVGTHSLCPCKIKAVGYIPELLNPVL